jgi:excisionase family DNA binding protein
MRGAPPHAGPRTTSAQVRDGEEVNKVGMSPSPVLGEVGRLPLVLDPVTAGRLLGMSRSTVYRHLQEGTFPAPAHRVGRSWHIPTAGILVHLGIDLTALSGCCGCGACRDEHQEADVGRS